MRKKVLREDEESWQWASLPIGEFDFGINKDGLCLLCFVA